MATACGAGWFHIRLTTQVKSCQLTKLSNLMASFFTCPLSTTGHSRQPSRAKVQHVWSEGQKRTSCSVGAVIDDHQHHSLLVLSLQLP
ncbi:hypothetical protein AOLI_G00195130 [Acnodon oligacanthus]